MSSKEAYPHSRLHQFLLWTLALILISVGVYLTRIQYLGTEWLSRAGCAIVILGIWSGLGVIIQERIILSRIKWQRRNSLTRARARLAEQEKSEEETKIELNEINEAYDKRADELTHKLKFSLGVLEVSLLITGTFLWGFGDLLI